MTATEPVRRGRVRIVMSMRTLMRLAREMAEAEATGDDLGYAVAKARHDGYQRLCLAADECLVEVSRV